MNIPPTLILSIVVLAAVLVPFVIMRLRMERRARALLAKHPNSEQISVYLALHSGWPHKKHQELDAKIVEMKTKGWTYTRGSEASPFRTIRTWGGGLTLHFIRLPDSVTNHAA